jgi:hypothetical protein
LEGLGKNTQFPQVNAFSKALYNYKMLIRVSPLLILPLGFVILVGVQFLIELEILYSSYLVFFFLFFDCLACFIAYTLKKTKNLLPQKISNYSEITFSLILIYMTLLFIDGIFFTTIIITIPALITNDIFPIVELIIDIILFYFLIDSLKKTIWFHKIPKMLIDSFKLDSTSITIKTSAGEVTGKVKNLYDPNFITLIEGDVQRFIPWNEVKVIEFGYNNQNIMLEAIEASGEKKKP